MNRIARATFAAGLLLASPAAAELTVTPGVTVINQCAREIIIAMKYKDSRGNWSIAPFATVRPRGAVERVVSTDNRIIYFYAETNPSGTRWTGDHQARVGNKMYPMKELQLNLDRRRNEYEVKLSC